MKRVLLFIFFAAIAVVFAPAGVRAQQDQPAAAQAPSGEEAEYAALVRHSYKMATGFDFARLRDLYGALPIYAPHKMNTQALFESYMERVLKGDRNVANEATVFVKTHAALPEVHMLAVPFFSRMKMERTSRYHEWMGNNLIAQIRKTGDGEGPETAYVPLTYTEEALLTQDSGETISRRKVEQDGRTYDVVMLEMDQSKRRVEIWFDTTIITTAENRE